MGNVGIDYGLGQSNIDAKTGIRYGVISQHSIMGEALSDMEMIYAFNCPDCGNESLVPSRSARYDYFCQSCRTWHYSDACYGDEPIGMKYEEEGYVLADCLDSDIMVIASPYYTHAQYCSPCVPGAGNLDHAMEEGVRTYCLGHDWFEDETAPYPVYRVSDEGPVAAAAVTAAAAQQQ